MNRIFVYEYLSAGGEVAAEAAGELLAMGQAMRDAVVADLLRLENYHVTVATCKQAAPPPQPARCVTPRDGESTWHFVQRQAEVHDLAWVIAPETDGLLAKLHACVPPGHWLGCDAASIVLATHKRRTLGALAAAGIATPLDFEHAPDTARWVVKPDDGAGAVATHVHGRHQTARDEAAARARAGEAVTLEPWVEGEALSLSLLCGVGRCELLCVNRQQIDVDALGLVSFRGVESNALPRGDARTAVLSALATRVQRAVPGLRGFVGIDVVWHAQHGPVVIEVNPRVTCAYVGLSRLLGRNLAADTMAAVRGDAFLAPHTPRAPHVAHDHA